MEPVGKRGGVFRRVLSCTGCPVQPLRRIKIITSVVFIMVLAGTAGAFADHVYWDGRSQADMTFEQAVQTLHFSESTNRQKAALTTLFRKTAEAVHVVLEARDNEDLREQALSAFNRIRERVITLRD